jgi:hypothetical protein
MGPMGDRVAYQPDAGRGAERQGGLTPAPRSATEALPEPVIEPTVRRGWAWTAIRGLREVILVVSVYSLYDVSRFLVKGDHDGAVKHGLSILRFERHLHIDPEHYLDKLFSAHLLLALPADYMYATLHYVVTPIVLIWLWRSHSASYSRARSVLLVATVFGLVGFSLLPVAPPRLLHGFIDTMAKEAHYGWWGKDASAPRGFGGDTNQFAALPSLHVGWALWSGWQLIRYASRRWVQILGGLYPIVISIVVVGTANHYLVDVFAGVAVLIIAWLFVGLLSSLQWLPWRRTTFSPSSNSRPGAA